MIEKFEFCSAEIIVNWCSPIRLLNMQKMVEKWLEIPHFCCHFAATFTFFRMWQQNASPQGDIKENTLVASKPKLDRGACIFYCFAPFSVQLGRNSL